MTAILHSGLTSITHAARIATLALSIATAGTAALATAPVEATGNASQPDVYACLTWGGTVYAGQPVFLYRYRSTGWYKARSATTNSNGCIRFNDLAAGQYFQVVGYKAWAQLSYYYWGESPVFKTASNDALFRYSITLYAYSW